MATAKINIDIALDRGFVIFCWRESPIGCHYINFISDMAIQDDFEKQGKWLLKYGYLLVIALFILVLIFVSFYETAPDRFYSRQSGNKHIYEYFCILCSLFGFTLRIVVASFLQRLCTMFYKLFLDASDHHYLLSAEMITLHLAKY